MNKITMLLFYITAALALILEASKKMVKSLGLPVLALYYLISKS